MKKLFLTVGIIIITAIFLFGCGKKAAMRLTSPVFNNNDFLPDKYACRGANVNPPLVIDDVPAGTQSLVLIVDDPDAPAGTWTHWLVWNIKPEITEIAENSVPAGAVEGTTSWGKPGYDGPCPPSGTHRYFFKVFALNCEISLSSEADINRLNQTMKDHIIAKAEIIAKYKK
ncbi:MAG TPA: YbhB/YbcL family Raf kinase inhibitor-like protein [Candidatus Woesebacteria bacterium]|nr:YbhB/YbcL family Raf kinase inhibitor-like protein [Candidatus Woesebacteria bacterium]